VDIRDGDLVRRARAGDAGAFRLLVERHFRLASTFAARLGGHPDDVDDIVQEAFLQAFLGLDRLRDPDRFSAWLAGIVRNVHRAAGRGVPWMLLAEWPEDLHPVSAQGLPSADDLDRAEALRAAVARLPDGQRRAVELYYYADLPAGQIGGSPGAVKASLHKARGRLREYITAHRPDLIPVPARRTAMTTVRIACASPHLGTRPDGSAAIAHILVVLADDAGHRAMGLWLRVRQGMALWRILNHSPGDSQPSAEESRAGDFPAVDFPAGDFPALEFSPEDLAGRLLAVAGGTVTGVDIDELGPNVLAAQIGVASPAGARQVTAAPGAALALAAALDVPVRVAGPLMDRLAVPVTPDDLLGPFVRRTPDRPAGPAGSGSGPGSGPTGPGSGPTGPGSGPTGPGSGPRNLAFADGLNDWIIRGSSRNEVTGAHWDDYAVTAAAGEATLSAAVPRPHGDICLGQEWLADDYRGATVTVRAEVCAQGVASHAELSLDIVNKPAEHGQDLVTRPAQGPHPVPIHRDTRLLSRTITGTGDWARYEIASRVPADAEHMGFELTLTGPGTVRLRNVELIRAD
jgi:RNA polymerase sigma factor (sigma-70 family)